MVTYSGIIKVLTKIVNNDHSILTIVIGTDPNITVSKNYWYYKASEENINNEIIFDWSIKFTPRKEILYFVICMEKSNNTNITGYMEYSFIKDLPPGAEQEKRKNVNTGIFDIIVAGIAVVACVCYWIYQNLYDSIVFKKIRAFVSSRLNNVNISSEGDGVV